MNSEKVANAVGVSAVTIARWIKRGVIRPTLRGNGKGDPNWWSDEDVDRVRAIVARLDWGMTLEAAAREADPPLPPPPTRVDERNEYGR